MAVDLPYDDHARAQMKQWVDNWKRVGPLLEERRVDELRRLTEVEAARIATEFLWTDQPAGGGDRGAGLVAMREALQKLAGQP
jgi:hypothetical protein